MHNTIHAPLVAATSEYFVGLSKAVLVNSQNGVLLASRFVPGTSIDGVLDKMRGEEDMDYVGEGTEASA